MAAGLSVAFANLGEFFRRIGKPFQIILWPFCDISDVYG
jgi:hypothetical protein